MTLSTGLASAITGGINAAIEGGGIKSIAQGAALGFVGGAVGGAVAGKVGGVLTEGFNIPGGIAYNNGVQVYAQTFNLGQIWVFVRNGSISDAGVNQTPR